MSQEAQSQDGNKYQVGLQHSDLAGIDINDITAANKDKTSDDIRVADSYIRVNWTVDDRRIERTPSQAVTDIGIKKYCLYPIPGSDVYSYRLEVYTETEFWGEEYHFCDETKDLYQLYAHRNVNTDIYSTSSWKDYSSTPGLASREARNWGPPRQPRFLCIISFLSLIFFFKHTVLGLKTRERLFRYDR
ncbi:hypothetical protein TWF128_001512 [Orbilia oligospora]|nr:hypothetical protein TWF128_001512 [Orbilia oligospora]